MAFAVAANALRGLDSCLLLVDSGVGNGTGGFGFFAFLSMCDRM